MPAKLGQDGRVHLDGKVIGTWRLDENDHCVFSGLDGTCFMCLTKSELRHAFDYGPPKPVEISIEIGGVIVPIGKISG